MIRRFRYPAATCCLFLAAVYCSSAHAQDASLTVVEGYAFHSDTLKPLKNVRVSVVRTAADSGSDSVEGITDANGFYTVAFDGSLAVQLQGQALCSGEPTRPRSTRTTFPLYAPARSTAYERNVYLKPPRGSTRCY